jgi:lipopolysaccharide transport system permease protein
MEAAAPPVEELPTTVIEHKTGWGFPDLNEIWAHRDLVYFLARRDIVTRYRQAVIGSLWAILQPLLMAAVFSVFFDLLIKVPTGTDIPYPVFATAGLVLWIPFVGGINAGSESAVGGEALISKIYLPRAVLPIAAVIPSTIDFALGFMVAIAVTLAYGVGIDLRILIVPLVWGLTITMSFGVALWFSALNVKYRDIGQLVAFLSLAGLFVTPIIYSFQTVTATFSPLVQSIYALNPMVGILELYRWALLDLPFPELKLLLPLIIPPILVVTGALYYERAQRSFADFI